MVRAERFCLLVFLLLLGSLNCSGQEVGIAVRNSLTGPALLRQFDPNSGSTIQSINVTGQRWLYGLAAGSDGFLYSLDGLEDASSDRLVRINPITGSFTNVGDTGFNWNLRFLDFHPSGTLYGGHDNQLFTLNTSTGAATFVATITGSSLGEVNGLAIRPDGVAFVSAFSGSVGSLRTIDLNTGVTTLVGSAGALSDANFIRDLEFRDNTLYALDSQNGAVSTINTSTGIPTQLYTLPSFGGGSAGLVFAAVPEPTTYALVGLGVSAAGYLRWRRRRRLHRLGDAELDEVVS